MNFISTHTWPDIIFILPMTMKMASSPSIGHWKLQRIVKTPITQMQLSHITLKAWAIEVASIMFIFGQFIKFGASLMVAELGRMRP